MWLFRRGPGLIHWLRLMGLLRRLVHWQRTLVGWLVLAGGLVGWLLWLLWLLLSAPPAEVCRGAGRRGTCAGAGVVGGAQWPEGQRVDGDLQCGEEVDVQSN